MGEEKKEQAKKTVKPPPRRYRVHYTGRLEDGSVFDTSRGKEPLTVPLGLKRVIPGFESALDGMGTGDRKTVTIPPSGAYGAYREELVTEVPREKFKDQVDLKAGQFLQLTNPMGIVTKVRVKEFDDEQVTLDANHPLAGKTLVFEIEVLEIL